jgi:hypothetical protein
MGRCEPIAGVGRGRGETGGSSGEARNAAPGGEESQRPRRERQSGVIECRGSLATGGALATLGRTGDVTKI